MIKIMEPHAGDDYPLAGSLPDEREIAAFGNQLLNLTSDDVNRELGDVVDGDWDDHDEDLTLEWPQEEWVLGLPPEVPREGVSLPVLPIFVGVSFFIAAGVKKIRYQLRNRRK